MYLDANSAIVHQIFDTKEGFTMIKKIYVYPYDINYYLINILRKYLQY